MSSKKDIIEGFEILTIGDIEYISMPGVFIATKLVDGEEMILEVVETQIGNETPTDELAITLGEYTVVGEYCLIGSTLYEANKSDCEDVAPEEYKNKSGNQIIDEHFSKILNEK